MYIMLGKKGGSFSRGFRLSAYRPKMGGSVETYYDRVF